MRSKLATSSYASVELQQPMEVETIATSKLIFGEERRSYARTTCIFFRQHFFWRGVVLSVLAFFTTMIRPLP